VKKPGFISAERQRIAKIFKTYVEKAVDELGPGYTVDLQGSFYTTPIRITIEISPINPIRTRERKQKKRGRKSRLNQTILKR
jgi:hypothetical protein